MLYHEDYLSCDFPISDKADDVVCFYISMVADAVSALASLRSSGILHRDISPGNFLCCPALRIWKLTDFNLAVTGITNEDDATTVDEHVVGTEGFQAPETLELKQYPFASDMFSMGRSVRQVIGYTVELMATTQSIDYFENVLCLTHKLVNEMQCTNYIERVPLHVASCQMDNIIREKNRIIALP